jgi:hypothetical protein
MFIAWIDENITPTPEHRYPSGRLPTRLRPRTSSDLLILSHSVPLLCGTHEKPRVTRLRPDSHEPGPSDVSRQDCRGSSRQQGVLRLVGIILLMSGLRRSGGRLVIGAPLQHGASNYQE